LRTLPVHLVVTALWLCACSKSDPKQVIRSFVIAANSGDAVRQTALLSSREQNGYGQYVLGIWYPDAELAHFKLDSIAPAAEQPLGRDTLLWYAWGTEPNWTRAPREEPSPTLSGTGIAPPQLEPDELTEAQIGALPRITARRDFWLVKEGSAWKITAEADKLGPLYIALDSLHARCGYDEDPRLCVQLAHRILPAAASLRIFPRENIEYAPRRIIHSAALLDSLRIENTSFRRMYMGSGGFFAWYIRNLSSQPIGHVGIRIIDATGAVVSDDAFTLDVPAGGRARGLTIVHENHSPPYRYELRSIDRIGEL
jgi:hypothetical protein